MESEDYKTVILSVMDVFIRDATARGISSDDLFKKLAVESLELAARVHVNFGGCDSSFLGMAADLLDHVRAGAGDQ